MTNRNCLSHPAFHW